MGLLIQNITVGQPVWAPDNGPKDAIWDFQDGDYTSFFPMKQSLPGFLHFQAGYGVHRNDSYWTEHTDIEIDEDRNDGSSWNFAASVGTWLSAQRLSAPSTALTPIDGSTFPSPNRLSVGENYYGNTLRTNPEARHYRMFNSAANTYQGILGAAWPYKIVVPKVSDPTYKWANQLWLASGGVKSSFNGGTWDMGSWGNFFTVFQKAVAITRNGTTVIANNAQISTYLSAPLQLNKTLNRGHYTSSTWAILKKNNLGNYVAATVNLDYVLNTGTFTSDIIEIQFQVPGDFKVTNTAVGSSSTFTGPNQMITTTIIRADIDNVTVVVNDKITFPTIKANMSATPVFTNIIVDDAPILEGIETFSVDITPSLDMQFAEWIQKTQTITNGNLVETEIVKTNDLNEAQWLQLMLDKALVNCVVINSDTSIALETRNCHDLGYNQTFRLPRGNYNCGYTVEPI